MKLSEFTDNYLNILNELGYDLTIITNPAFRGLLMGYINDANFVDENPEVSFDETTVSFYSETIDDDCIIQEGRFKLEQREGCVVFTSDKIHPYIDSQKFMGSRIVSQSTLTPERNDVVKMDVVSSYIFHDPRYFKSEFEVSTSITVFAKDGTVINRSGRPKEVRFIAHRDVENMSTEDCLFIPKKIPRVDPYLIKKSLI